VAKSKNAASVTDTPEGLDVAVTQPGTIVGSHDLQGTDGTERTDRPGEILGTPVLTPANEERARSTREREEKRASYIASEVDRANREELPKLGGPIDDNWEPGESKGSKTAALEGAPHPAAVSTAAPARTTDAARSADSGIRVKPGVDR
jgi:hypothetical protein